MELKLNDLLTINPNNELEINRKELYLIPEYKELFVNDKGCKGDYDGRLKITSKKILFYIYLIKDPKSILYNLDENQKKEQALKDTGLKQEEVETERVVNCIKRYESDLLLTSTAKTFLGANKALFSLGYDLELQQDTIATLKASLNAKHKFLLAGNLGVAETVETAGIILGILKELNNVQKEQISTIQSVPKLKETVDIIANQLAEEGGGKIAIYGGGTLGNRE